MTANSEEEEKTSQSLTITDFHIKDCNFIKKKEKLITKKDKQPNKIHRKQMSKLTD
jgi:hypothetical protein